MIPEWIRFIDSPGNTETSIAFLNLKNAIDEEAILSENAMAYNNPTGHTKYYKYIQSELAIGFRKSVVNHVHFYFDGYEGYANFKGKLLPGICSG